MVASTPAGCSPASEKLSPVYRKQSQRDRGNDHRKAEHWKEFRLFVTTCIVVSLELVVFRSAILAFLLRPVFVSQYVAQGVECLLFTYTFIGAVSSYFHYSPTSLKVFDWMKFGSSPQKPPQSPNTTQYYDMTTELSWVDGHKFGTPQAKEVSFFKGGVHDTSMNHGSSPEGLSSPRMQVSHRKSEMSIYTRQQLDQLLRADSENPITDQTHMPSNIFDAMSGDANKSYHVSEPVPDNETSPYRVKIGTDGRVNVTFRGDESTDELAKMKKMMQMVRTSPEKTTLKRSNSVERSRGGVRRMSHSSPERPADHHSETSHKAGPLTDAEVKYSEGKVRAWLCNTILKPLVKRIDELNKILDKENATPSLKIGVSTPDALKLAMLERETLKTSALPFVLPFLNAHSNQSYLVNRIRELSRTELMNVYKWNAGGDEADSDKGLRQTFKKWNETLPTDAGLLFSLFSTYMDSQLNSNAVIGPNRLDQPFSGRYTLKHPEKPSKLHQTPFAYYVHMASDAPPQFDFMHNDMWATSTKVSMGKHSGNLFNAITHLVHHCKEENDGFLDRTSIGPHGLNLSIVL